MRRRAIQWRVMYERFMWDLPGHEAVRWSEVIDRAICEPGDYA